MPYELLRHDVINGSRKKYTEAKGTIFQTKKEIEAFRARIQQENPDCEVFLIYKDLTKA